MSDSNDNKSSRPDENVLVEGIIAHWPGDWPGRRIVDLDCVGDPGCWIDEQIPSPEEVLLAEVPDDKAMAEVLADAYISKGKELGFPLPSDNGMGADEEREIAIDDFLGFISEWRRRTLAEQKAASAEKHRKKTNRLLSPPSHPARHTAAEAAERGVERGEARIQGVMNVQTKVQTWDVLGPSRTGSCRESSQDELRATPPYLMSHSFYHRQGMHRTTRQ